MLEIKNTEIFGLHRALVASGNPMTVGEINTINSLALDDPKHEYRGKKLGATRLGSAHDHFLLGVHVQFDIKYPQYWTIEAERYHNFEIISSQSKMHKLTMMGRSDEFEIMFNKYVDADIIKRVQYYIEIYNSLASSTSDTIGGYPVVYPDGIKAYFNSKKEWEEEKYERFMQCISNLPLGFEMWMTCDLTYLQLKTIFFQRNDHKLKEDWGNFCKWCTELPMFCELTGINKEP